MRERTASLIVGGGAGLVQGWGGELLQRHCQMFMKMLEIELPGGLSTTV